MNTKVQQALPLATQIRQITDEVLLQNIGRGDLVTVTWLSLIAQRPAFFLGLTGVNKTRSVQEMSKRITGAVFYERLIPQIHKADQLWVTRTRVLEEIVDGGKAISILKDYGYAAEAHIVFFDEMFKDEKNPALMEIIDFALDGFIRTDTGLLQTPLMSLLAAGNEVPENDGDLGATWSRMTLRLQVRSLDRNQKKALHDSRMRRYRGEIQKSRTTTMSLDDLKVLQEGRPFVTIPDTTIETVLDIYDELSQRTDADFTYLLGDDRRFGRTADVMQANALLNGRDTVATEDLRVLEWMLWDTPEQIPVLNEVLAEYIRTSVSEAQELVNALLSPTGAIEAAKTGDINQGVSALSQLQTATAELDRLIGEASSDVDRQAIRELKQKVSEAQNKVLAKVTGQS